MELNFSFSMQTENFALMRLQTSFVMDESIMSCFLSMSEILQIDINKILEIVMYKLIRQGNFGLCQILLKKFCHDKHTITE